MNLTFCRNYIRNFKFSPEKNQAEPRVLLEVERGFRKPFFLDEVLLLRIEGVGPAGGMEGVLFEAYASHKIPAGGEFQVKPLGTGTEDLLQLLPTTILQKNTKQLIKTMENTKQLIKTIYPPDVVADRLVWPNPDYNLPTIDMFMLHNSAIIAYQLTVSQSHTLDIGGVKGFLRFFDSVCKDQ